MPSEQYQSSKKIYNTIVGEITPLYGEEEARQLTKILLTEILEISFEKIIIDEKVDYSSALEEQLFEKVKLLKNYMPIQYALGKANFYGRDFFVNPNVLIPRSETEELIKEIVADNKQKGLTVLDIGSGSGCIGVTLGLELKDSKITCMDIDGEALNMTLKNASAQGVDITCKLKDILSVDQLPTEYDVIVSNPPYVTEAEKHQMHTNVLKYEPAKALFVPDGNPLIFYKKIIELAKNSLKEKGKLYFEINEHFGLEMLALCEDSGFSSVGLIKDINGKDRFIKAYN